MESVVEQKHQISVAASLRQATQDLHRELDNHSLVKALLQPSVCNESYRLLLQGFQRAYQILEPALIATELSFEHVPTPPYIPRLPALATELHHHSFTPPDVGIVAPMTMNAYWGTRYVLDGSCHGAAILLPRFRKQLNLSKITAFNYWQQLADLHAHWPMIIERLQQRGNSPCDIAEMSFAAQNTFKHFIKALITEHAA